MLAAVRVTFLPPGSSPVDLELTVGVPLGSLRTGIAAVTGCPRGEPSRDGAPGYRSAQDHEAREVVVPGLAGYRGRTGWWQPPPDPCRDPRRTLLVSR